MRSCIAHPLLCLVLAAPPAGAAAGPGPADRDTLEIRQATVIGKASRLPSMPGSAHLLTRSDLERQKATDLHRALAEVPGVSVQEEEGFGLRPNISLRGVDPERSRNITVLEDGLLAAPAPYAAPSIHILPPVGRLSGIEILKGSSQVKYGPRSQGGVVNLLTTPIPSRFRGHADVSSGPGGRGRVHAHAGAGGPHVGYLVEIFRDGQDGFQRLPGSGPTGYDLEDYLAKLRLSTHPDAPRYQEIELRASRNSQTSNSSYLGLTDADFAEDPYARYPASRHDQWKSGRDALQARYAARPLPWLDVSAAAYRQTLERDWYKVSAAAGTPIATVLKRPEEHARAYAALRGEGGPGDTLDLEGNKRDFAAEGVQAAVTLRGRAGRWGHETELGVRFHRDSEDRREYVDRWIAPEGRMALVRKGLPGEKSNRLAEAESWAFHAQERLRFGRLGLVPGVRHELIALSRRDWAKDLARSTDPRTDEATVDAWAWGAGATWDLAPGLHLFGGLHKGISPPVPGNSDSAESEESLNYELGARASSGPWGLDMTAFLADYRNLLGTELAASGGLSTERQFNGGGVLVYGLEAAARADAGRALALPVSLPVRLAYTFTHTEFRSSFRSPLEQWLSVEAGDELPYIPRHQVAAGLGIAYGRARLDVVGKYVGEMRAVAGQGPIPYAEAAGDYSFVDATVEVAATEAAHFYFVGRNLLDDVGLAARNPAGVRPTLPRSFAAGIRSGF